MVSIHCELLNSRHLCCALSFRSSLSRAVDCLHPVFYQHREIYDALEKSIFYQYRHTTTVQPLNRQSPISSGHLTSRSSLSSESPGSAGVHKTSTSSIFSPPPSAASSPIHSRSVTANFLSGGVVKGRVCNTLETYTFVFASVVTIAYLVGVT